jgi:hypothetical protein
MSLSDLASLGSFVSGVAVLISLVFLYFQVRQVEKNQQATVRQQRASRGVAVTMGAATEPSLVEAIYKASVGATDITSTQLLQLLLYSNAQFLSFEDSFLQHRNGLMTDSDFGSVINSVRAFIRLPGFRVQWKRGRMGYGTEFVEFMDALLATTPAGLGSLDPAEWLIERAKENVLVAPSP